MRVPTHRESLFLRLAEIAEKLEFVGVASVREEIVRDWHEIRPGVRREVVAMRELHATEGPTS